jgi:arylsulfatase A-like enzyme
MVEAVDQSVGRILRRLEQAGIADRTVIFFTSDNGGLAVKEGQWQPTSNYPLRAGKGFLYEGGIRVPWIVRWPGAVKPGSVCDVPIISNDVLPTILDIAGVSQKPSPPDGLSVVPLLKGGTKMDREALFWHYPHYANQGSTPGGAVRIGDWKLIEDYEHDSLELYDLREDPRESRSIADQQPRKTAELHQMLRNWRNKVGAQMPTGRARKGAREMRV